MGIYPRASKCRVQRELKSSQLLCFGASLKYCRTLCYNLFFFFLIASAHVCAASPRISSFTLSEIDNQDISQQLSYFSVADSQVPAYESQLPLWLQSLSEHLETNSFGDRYVAVFELFNDTQNLQWFVYPYGSVVQNIEIHTFSENQSSTSVATGHGLTNQQDFHYGAQIDLLPGESKTLVVLFESEFFFAPIKILVLPQAAAVDMFNLENVVLLISLGICLALGIYNLFIYMVTINRQYLFYALSTFSYAFGWACVFGVFEFVGTASTANWLMPAYLIGTIFSAYFNVEFLRLNETAPKTSKILKIIALGSVLSLPLAFYEQGLGLILASIFSSAALLVGLYSGIRAWKKGYSPARYFVLALLSVLLPNMVGNLMNLGVLPGLNVNIYLLGLVGNCLDALLLAFALAVQVRLLNKRNIELTTQLEQTVNERTKELKATNFQLQQSNSELVEASNAKGWFLANMSHEIRTPLTSIIGYADAILLGDIDKSEQPRVTRIICDNGNHLLNVINDILDISKIEANKLDFESIPTSLFSVLAQIESIVGKRARDKGLAFHLEYQYPLPAQIYTDPTRLKQILFNLTNNALKFTEQGYIGLSVTIENRNLLIEVKDSGEGISAAQQDSLFTPFTQADSSTNRRFGGTGLGLSISQRLAQGLGGKITVDSALRKGSTFTLSIDLKVVEDTPMINSVTEIWQSTPAKSLKPTSLPSFEGSKVLLADDHPSNRELIALLLTRMNIKVTQVENGKQVLDILFYQKFDLILLDIHMPEMDGAEALKRIRASGNYTPVIALTANNMKHEIEHYLRIGFSDHLAKPILRHHLINKLSQYLDPERKTDDPLNKSDMLMLIQGYQKELKKQLIKIEAAWAQKNMSSLAETSHRIKGSAGSFGFEIIGNKFAEIEQHALQDDELAIANELPDVISSARNLLELPGIDVSQAMVNHSNSAELFLQRLTVLLKHGLQTLQNMQDALDNGELNSALVHLYKYYPDVRNCALIESIGSFDVLEDMIKSGNLETQHYQPLLSNIRNHLKKLLEVS
jgi:signal transduction histidine kinase/DNA-binding NarL/FixJ family response regulator